MHSANKLLISARVGGVRDIEINLREACVKGVGGGLQIAAEVWAADLFFKIRTMWLRGNLFLFVGIQRVPRYFVGCILTT